MPKKKKTPSTGRKKTKDIAKAKPEAPTRAECDVCGYEVFENHCRIVCPKCGATRDCSDP